MSAASQAKNNSSQEYTVRTAAGDGKAFNVMRFVSGSNVVVKNWKATGEKVKLERENGLKDGQNDEDNEPRFGAGSEFGRIERNEARQAKYRPRKIREQPYTLKVGGKSGSEAKKFIGKRDGGVGENASYYIFFHANDGAFEATPVNEWYNFAAIQRFKALTAEEAEELFEKRSDIRNYAPIMDKMRKNVESLNEAAEGGKKIKKEKSSFKTSELDEWGGIGESDLDSDDDDEDGMKSKKNKKKGKPKKVKKESDDERSAEEESDEGDFDQREVDYISNSSSSESEPEEVRVSKELKGVADEDGLRKIIDSDDDEEDEEAKKNGDSETNGQSKDPEVKKDDKKSKEDKNKDGEISESSAEDEDDSDLDEPKYFPKAKSVTKSGSEHGSAPTSRAVTPVKDVVDGTLKSGIKRKNDSTPSSPAPSTSNSKPSTPTLQPPPAKKPKGSESDGVTEENVRRYLMRRPMTVKDLIKKFRKKGENKEELVTSIASILKKIAPDRQTIRGELHLSLKAQK